MAEGNTGQTGQEFMSIVNLVVKYEQPELKKLDPKNKLLECKIRDIGGGIDYHPAFGERFDGMPLNMAVYTYHSLLEREINNLNVKKEYKKDKVN